MWALLFLVAIPALLWLCYWYQQSQNDGAGPVPAGKKIEGEKVVVAFQGSRYDITDFVKYHPGGKDVLLEHNGRDVEQPMLDNKHSVHAYERLKSYKIDE